VRKKPTASLIINNLNLNKNFSFNSILKMNVTKLNASFLASLFLIISLTKEVYSWPFFHLYTRSNPINFTYISSENITKFNRNKNFLFKLCLFSKMIYFYTKDQISIFPKILS